MGPRIFSVREANALLPDLEQMFKSLDGIRERIRRIKSKADVLEMLWGEEIHSESTPDHKEHAHYMEQLEKLKQEFKSATERFAQHEVVLKSIETGLVDFYGVVDRRLVFLCWKRGEKEVEFYHHLEDGFAGRQPLPATGVRDDQA
jgi:hypothetical protein